MKHHRKISYVLFLVLFAMFAGCERSEKMLDRLQFVKACNRADTVFTVRWLPMVNSLVDYFSSHGTDNDRMMAYYLQGRVYHDIGEAVQALESYQCATEYIDTTSAACDLNTAYAIYGQLADLFHDQFLPDNEMRALKKAERIAQKRGGALDAIKAFELRARPYFLKAETDSMLIVRQEARKRYLEIGRREEAAQAIYPTISIFLDRQQIQEAGRYLDLYERESGNFDENGDLISGGFYYYDKGRYLLKVGKIDSACRYFYKALTYNQKEAGYCGLLSVYEKERISDSIAKYARLYVDANDSSYSHVNQEKMQQISAMYDYSRHQRIAEENETKASLFRLYFFMALFILIAVVLLFSYLYNIYNQKRIKTNQEINRLIKLKNEYEAVLNAKQARIDAIKEENDIKIERIQQQHRQELQSLVDEKQVLQKRLDELDEGLHRTSIGNLKEAFFETAIYQVFQRIKEKYPLLKGPTALDWEMFQKTFKDFFPHYIAFLNQNHTLTQEHLYVCLLLPLGYKEAEIAFFLGVDGPRINRLKSQINSKLFKKSGSKSLRNNLNTHFYGSADLS